MQISAGFLFLVYKKSVASLKIVDARSIVSVAQSAVDHQMSAGVFIFSDSIFILSDVCCQARKQQEKKSTQFNCIQSIEITDQYHEQAPVFSAFSLADHVTSNDCQEAIHKYKCKRALTENWYSSTYSRLYRIFSVGVTMWWKPSKMKRIHKIFAISNEHRLWTNTSKLNAMKTSYFTLFLHFRGGRTEGCSTRHDQLCDCAT